MLCDGHGDMNEKLQVELKSLFLHGLKQSACARTFHC
jgi:hypothetical protein